MFFIPTLLQLGRSGIVKYVEYLRPIYLVG